MLYKITPIDHSARPWATYDVAVGFVVSAESPEDARRIAAKCAGAEGREVWHDEKVVSVEPLEPNIPRGLILRSFIAG